MARVRSTARVSCEGDDAETTDTSSISKMMRRSGLVTSEKAISKVKLSKLSRLQLRTEVMMRLKKITTF
jgi:hypothetical protein